MSIRSADENFDVTPDCTSVVSSKGQSGLFFFIVTESHFDKVIK